MSTEVLGAEQLLPAALEQLPVAVVVIDAVSGRPVFSNRAARKITGAKLVELETAEGVAHLTSEGRRLGIHELPLARVRLGETIRNERITYVTAEGERSTPRLSAVPIRDGQDEVVAMAAVLVDISSEDATEAAMRDRTTELEGEAVARKAELAGAVEELEAFAYSVSHDLRAPLRAISSFAEMLAEEHAELLAGDARRRVDQIRANAERMGRLIDELLRLSRFGRRPIERTSVDPALLAADALTDLEAERAGRDVRVRIDELPGCRADPVLLRQVYFNLLSNAVKFTRGRDPAEITVGAHATNGTPTAYFVSDNGAGFDARYADKLFGPFQRLHRAEDFEGTGVGLALVKRIVHRHGGRVWAESGPDLGATFWFTLEEGSPE